MTIREVSEKFGMTQDTLRYYERVGMIPPVTRTASGLRDYSEKALRWVSLAICMRSAGLPVESIVEYVRLFQQGDTTIPARLQLLIMQREALVRQRQQIDDTLEKLTRKISIYEKAIGTGRLDWTV